MTLTCTIIHCPFNYSKTFVVQYIQEINSYLARFGTLQNYRHLGEGWQHIKNCSRDNPLHVIMWRPPTWPYFLTWQSSARDYVTSSHVALLSHVTILCTCTLWYDVLPRGLGGSLLAHVTILCTWLIDVLPRDYGHSSLTLRTSDVADLTDVLCRLQWSPLTWQCCPVPTPLTANWITVTSFFSPFSNVLMQFLHVTTQPTKVFFYLSAISSTYVKLGQEYNRFSPCMARGVCVDSGWGHLLLLLWSAHLVTSHEEEGGGGRSQKESWRQCRSNRQLHCTGCQIHMYLCMYMYVLYQG